MDGQDRIRQAIDDAEPDWAPEPYLGFNNLREVESRLAELYRGINEAIGGRLDFAYSDGFLKAGAALDHFSPGEFIKLTDRLKGSGVKISDWKSAVAKTVRIEKDRLKEQLAGTAGGQQGQSSRIFINIPEVQPAALPVTNAAALFDQIKVFVKRFVILNEYQVIAVVLWTAFTHCFDVAEVSPRLAVLSPKMRCGKTTLQRVLAMLCRRPLTTSNISATAIFRTIDQYRPTVLMDEVDSFAGRGTKQSERSEEMRGILNSGHTPDHAHSVRNDKVDGQWQPRQFSTWAPITYAAIGRLPETWEDRSIILMMKRKKKTEKVEKLTRRTLKPIRKEAEHLVSQLARWAKDNLDVLSRVEPPMPAALNDRAEDNWDLLIGIADQVSMDWGKIARNAAVALSGDRPDTDADSGLDIRLLSDIRLLMEEQGTAFPLISSTELCKELVAMKDAPWASMPKTGKPLTTTRLAMMLRPFEILPDHKRDGNGFTRASLIDAFSRYLTEPETADPPSPETPDPSSSENPASPFFCENPRENDVQRFTSSHLLRREAEDSVSEHFTEQSSEASENDQFSQRRVANVKTVKSQNAENDPVIQKTGFADGSEDIRDDVREAEIDRLAKADKEEEE